MKELLYTYMMSLIRPFETQGRLKQQRLEGAMLNSGVISLHGEKPDFNEFESDSSMSFIDAMSVSWVFVIIKTAYAFGAFYLGIEWFSLMGQRGENLAQLEFWGQKVQTITFFMIILEVILFPLTLWFYAKFWGVIIRFFGDVFAVEGDHTQVSEQIVNHSLSSHFFLVIPVFGELAKHISSLVLIYAGLKSNMGLSTSQSLMVMLSPILLVLFVIFLIFLYIILMISFI